jgi:hypothetical protein
VVRNDTQDESGEPDNQAQERESLRSPPLTTVVAAAQTDPAPRPRATTSRAIEPDNKQCEHGGPACCEHYTMSVVSKP